MKLRKKELIVSGITTIAQQITFELDEKSIEKNASLKRGALYDEFESKKEFINECFLYIANEVLKSNEACLKLKAHGKSVKEKGRTIWFNTIAWWLSNSEMFAFYLKYLTSRYYFENDKIKSEMRSLYFSFSESGIQAGLIKPLPKEFIHELIVAQMVNTIGYIHKNPKLSADSEFLDLSFEALWDSIRTH